MPGTHFRNAPTDRMATYANFREQVALTVKAGTVAITHYDIWHAASENRGARTRYMLKFLFSRSGEPAAPSWNHDPDRAAALLSRFTFEKAATCSQSDHYKERGLRREMKNGFPDEPCISTAGGHKLNSRVWVALCRESNRGCCSPRVSNESSPRHCKSAASAVKNPGSTG